MPLPEYGVLASTSIIDLFLAGVVPGILLGLSQMAVIQLVARKRGSASGQPASAAKILSTGRRAVPAMVLPFIILAGILGGVFTPTEAGAVARTAGHSNSRHPERADFRERCGMNGASRAAAPDATATSPT